MVQACYWPDPDATAFGIIMSVNADAVLFIPDRTADMAAEWSMKEKELRLGLVCYGGVSLALYMHGVIKEILKLSRASKAYHSIPELEHQKGQSFEVVNGDDSRPHDTEDAYFALLQSIGQTLSLRVIVDSIAGASAGGISGIVLARALAHDLSIDHLRDLWLDESDILRLLGSSQRARPWSKWFLRPVLWTLFRLRRLGPAVDREIEKNLSMFLRSRWFESPFDGDRFLELLHDGLSAMRRHGDKPSSLLPPGHTLNLAVSITDFFGYARDVKINTPPVISEREHGLFWTFKYRGWSDAPSDLDDGNVPGLALAARATSSFPGAFPPVQLSNLDRLLAKRGLEWPNRQKFIASNFKGHISAGIDPENTSLLDGGIVNNKPFATVLNMVREHRAYRDVDRRLVYIEPDPERSSPPPDGHVPTFIRTLEGAILEIPLHAPIYRELAQVHEFNETAKRMRSVLKAAYPELAGFVTTVTEQAPSTENAHRIVEHWRETANALAAKEASYAYQVYARFKTFSIFDTLVGLTCDLGEIDQTSPIRTRLADEILSWANRSGALPPEGSLSTASGSQPQRWIDFLLQFDIEFRRRRLSFVTRGLNLLYSRLDESCFREVKPHNIDELKTQFQSLLNPLRGSDFGGPALRARIAALADKLSIVADGEGEGIVAARESLNQEMDAIMEQLHLELDLAGLDRVVDAIVASSMDGDVPAVLHHEVLIYYIGFPFWDVWTFPISEWRAVEEHRELRVDRISPNDAVLLRNGADTTRLKGAEFRHFAGFLSRSRREHDYLWGRLHGAERLIDIVSDAAAMEDALGTTNISALKKTAFLAILDTEEHHLLDKSLLALVRSEVSKL
jgi:patatin-related protein